MPIYQTSTFIFDNVVQGARRFAQEEDGCIYSRLGNPTVSALEQKMADRENGQAAAAFASGMGAISAVMIQLVIPNMNRQQSNAGDCSGECSPLN